jgi:hypothetical protein
MRRLCALGDALLMAVGTRHRSPNLAAASSKWLDIAAQQPLYSGLERPVEWQGAT